MKKLLINEVRGLSLKMLKSLFWAGKNSIKGKIVRQIRICGYYFGTTIGVWIASGFKFLNMLHRHPKHFLACSNKGPTWSPLLSCNRHCCKPLFEKIIGVRKSHGHYLSMEKRETTALRNCLKMLESSSWMPSCTPIVVPIVANHSRPHWISDSLYSVINLSPFILLQIFKLVFAAESCGQLRRI